MNRQSTITSEASKDKTKTTRTFLINQPKTKKYPLNVIKTAKYTM